MMHPPLIDVTEFKIVREYTLCVTFEDGAIQRINFEPMLYGPIFGPLRDLYLFNQVALDSEAGTLVWPNGADFDPTNLYNWPKDGPYFVAKAQRWRKAAPSTSNGTNQMAQEWHSPTYHHRRWLPLIIIEDGSHLSSSKMAPTLPA